MKDAVPVATSIDHRDEFERKARSLGFQPTDPWVGGYVSYEWAHLRHLITALPIEVAGMEVLEVGCNVGASAIVMSKLGANVTAFDISPDFVDLAKLNARQYECEKIIFDYVEDSRRLPYLTGKFDLVVCNSVLEYVPMSHQSGVISEMGRVLRIGGLLLLTGTSNQLWPRELHSGRWGTNYLPRVFDSLLGRSIQRGLTPWNVTRHFDKTFRTLDNAAANGFYARSRGAMGVSKTKLRVVLLIAKLFRTQPGFLTPSLSCLLQKIG